MFKSKKGFIYQRENLKTMILSKINYIISSIHLPETILVQRNRILFRFLKNPKDEGILKKSKKSFSPVQISLSQWAEALCSSQEEDWETKVCQTLGPLAGKPAFFALAKPSRINGVKNQFWKRVLETRATFNKHSGSKDFIKQPIFNNKCFRYHNESLDNEMCIKSNIIFKKLFL